MLHNKHHILNLCYPRIWPTICYVLFRQEHPRGCIIYARWFLYSSQCNDFPPMLSFGEPYQYAPPSNPSLRFETLVLSHCQGASGDLGISVIWLKYQIVPTRSRMHANIPHADRHISCMIIDLTILKSSHNPLFQKLHTTVLNVSIHSLSRSLSDLGHVYNFNSCTMTHR